MGGLSAVASEPDYFPLQPGNEWVYKASGRLASQGLTVHVAGHRTAGGQVYVVLSGFPEGDLLLRVDPPGKLYVWNPEAKRERLWLDFSAPAGSTFALDGDIESCTGTARLVSSQARYAGAAGESDRALQVSYTQSCRDAGLLEDIFLPGVGLVRRTFTTIAGPVVLELVQGRVKGLPLGQDK